MAYNFDTAVTANMTGVMKTPALAAYSDGFAVDPAIRSPIDAGYVKTRARFTSIPRIMHIRYEGLTTHDKNLIYEFEKTVVGGSESFTWTRPPGGEIKVRFVGTVSFTPWDNTNYAIWNVEYNVESIDGDL